MITRRDFLVSSALSAAALRRGATLLTVQSRPRPTRAQLAWQRDELAMFLHFGINTFTDREWGDGKEDPAIFNPSALDARQWTRLARDTGFRAIVLTAKHHDGFCLWPTRTTAHSVASSPWRGGRGDVVRELAEACRADGIKLGLYLSPWDRNAPVYGDTPRYNDLYAAQLTELLTWYGAVHEVWFDGANGEGPNGRRQQYDWPRVHATVRRLQPDAVMFSDAGPDVRWIGNERGTAGETNWSTVDPAAVPYPGAEGPLVTRMLQEGDPAGSVWRPGETDVSIRPGWFYHPAEDARVRTVDDLVDIYFSSVGRNSKLLLNVPPDRTGRIAAVDEERLRGMRRRLDLMFATELSRGRRWSRRIVGGVPQWTVDLRRDVSIGVVDLREPIERGQVVASYRVEGRRGDAWQLLSQGTTIGARKLDRLTPVEVSEVRVTITSAMGLPAGLEVRLFG